VSSTTRDVVRSTAHRAYAVHAVHSTARMPNGVRSTARNVVRSTACSLDDVRSTAHRSSGVHSTAGNAVHGTASRRFQF